MILTIDFETYFSDDYTLRKLTTEAYIRDERFAPLCLCALDEEGRSWQLWGRDEIATFIGGLDPGDTIVIAHHAQFDCAILSFHFDFRPALIIDTLSMARLLIGNHVSVSLDSLARLLDLPSKSVPYNLFMGQHADELDLVTRHALLEGCMQDVRLTQTIAHALLSQMPPEELWVIDRTVRMFTEPMLIGDQVLLEQEIIDEARRKYDLFTSLGIDQKILSSTAKFAALLELLGVEVELKQGKNGLIPALAKSDEFLQSLQDSDDELLSSLAEARIEAKSTITGTRARRMLDMAQRGPLAVYLAAYGAQTLRYSGGDSINWQNLPRGSNLRKAIRAPEGHLVLAIDLAQIEARLLMWCAGERDHLAAFADPNRDPYCEQASETFGRSITKADVAERQCGKRIVLSGGYGASAPRMWHQLKADMRQMRLDYVVSYEIADRGIERFRANRPGMRQLWKNCELILFILHRGETVEEPFGLPITVSQHKIFLPNGAPMIYHLERLPTGEWRRQTKTGFRRIYGAVIVQNLMEAFARLVVTQAAKRIEDRWGLRMCNMTHDELMYVVPEGFAEAKEVCSEMARMPEWAPGLILDAEFKLESYYAK